MVKFIGRHHAKYVEICSCESTAVTLVRLNFWPGSPEKPTVAFHFSLMRLCEKLFLQCQVSLFNFVEVLKALHPPLHPTLVLSVYSILNSGCFEEFRQFQYQCSFLSQRFANLENGSICPLCPEDNGTVIECFDACMGLVRKRSKGALGQRGQMRHLPLFFSDQNDVDSFVDSYNTSEGAEIEKDCSRFHAGEVLSSLRSKGKNRIFEEKGVFGRVCRHDYPKGFLNLKYGERLVYMFVR
ncbi:hypothetical protein QZH41_013095 [Actinostola sp. cb2023]|nr:hypothetical protein QZH41_013095 [Actinostola sp. cb2023]